MVISRNGNRIVIEITSQNLLHLIENTFDRKPIYTNPSSYPNSNSSPNTNPNLKAQLCFQTDEMTSFFDQVCRYPHHTALLSTVW